MSADEKTLNPRAALASAAQLLERDGFAIVARNERGDSLYLARAGESATLRLSNHARRPKQRRSHPEVAASLIIRTPKSAAQIAGMVAAALRDFAAGWKERTEARPQPSKLGRH